MIKKAKLTIANTSDELRHLTALNVSGPLSHTDGLTVPQPTIIIAELIPEG
jgi:hypothetical protein